MSLVVPVPVRCVYMFVKFQLFRSCCKVPVFDVKLFTKKILLSSTPVSSYNAVHNTPAPSQTLTLLPRATTRLYHRGGVQFSSVVNIALCSWKKHSLEHNDTITFSPVLKKAVYFVSMYVNLYMSLPDVDNVAILVSFFGDMAIFGGKNGDMVIFEFLRYGEKMAMFFEKNGDMVISGLPPTPSPCDPSPMHA